MEIGEKGKHELLDRKMLPRNSSINNDGSTEREYRFNISLI